MLDLGCEGLDSNKIAQVGPAHRPESGPYGRRLPEMNLLHKTNERIQMTNSRSAAGQPSSISANYKVTQ